MPDSLLDAPPPGTPVPVVDAPPRTVAGVLQEIDDALGNVAQVLALGPDGTPIGSRGEATGEVVDLAWRLAAALASSRPAVPGDSARCIVSTAEHCLFVYRLGVDLLVVLVGPPDWNLALTGRLTEQLLVDLVDLHLRETASAADPAAPPGPLPRRSAAGPASAPAPVPVPVPVPAPASPDPGAVVRRAFGEATSRTPTAPLPVVGQGTDGPDGRLPHAAGRGITPRPARSRRASPPAPDHALLTRLLKALVDL